MMGGPSSSMEESASSPESSGSLEETQDVVLDDRESVAVAHSALASRYWKEREYGLALNSYQEALHLYQSENPSLLDLCNAAATLHNMGLLHRRCRRYSEAVDCFLEAENLYRSCALQIEPQEYSADGVCLDQLLVETLQSRAIVHAQCLLDCSSAIDCHEEVVAKLLGLEAQERTLDEPYSNAQNVTFVRMNDRQRVTLLSESLTRLGNLYLSNGEEHEALGAFEEALDMLRCRHDEYPDEMEVQRSMATILMTLSSVYFNREEFDRTIDALQDVMELHAATEPDSTHPDAYAAMNNMGLAYERKGDLDRALVCYEDLLHLRSRSLGNNHVDVAESLTTVAKVLERQTNFEGALDLYQEALRIYNLTENSQGFNVNVAEVHSRIAGILLAEARAEEAIDSFRRALEFYMEEELQVDVANTYHGLGRAHMAMNNYTEARMCLLKSAELLQSTEAVVGEAGQERTDMFQHVMQSSLSLFFSDGSALDTKTSADTKAGDDLSRLTLQTNPMSESSISNDGGRQTSEPDIDPHQSQLVVYGHGTSRAPPKPEGPRSATKRAMGDECSSVASSVRSTSRKIKSEHVNPKKEVAKGAQVAAWNPYPRSSTSPVRRDVVPADTADFDPYNSSPRHRSAHQSHSCSPRKHPVASISPHQTAQSDVAGSTKTRIKRLEGLYFPFETEMIKHRPERTLEPREMKIVDLSTSGSPAMTGSTAPSAASTPSSFTLVSKDSPGAMRESSDLDTSALTITDHEIEPPFVSESPMTTLARIMDESDDDDDSESKRHSRTSVYSGYDTSQTDFLTADRNSVTESEDMTESHQLSTVFSNSEYDTYCESDTHEMRSESQSHPTTEFSTDETQSESMLDYKSESATSREQSYGSDTSNNNRKAHAPNQKPRRRNNSQQEGTTLDMSSSELVGQDSKDSSRRAMTRQHGQRKVTFGISHDSPSSSRKNVDSTRHSGTKLPRNRLAKAFTNTFLRGRRRNRLDSMPEDDENGQLAQHPDGSHRLSFEYDHEVNKKSIENGVAATDAGPIQFVSMNSLPFDDSVSQITFMADEQRSGRLGRSGSWWWGVSSEGIDAWFPAAYITEAVVGVAEEFLSAQSIHDQVKSMKLDASSADSTDESDPFEDLSDSDNEPTPSLAARKVKDPPVQSLLSRARRRKSNRVEAGSELLPLLSEEATHNTEDINHEVRYLEIRAPQSLDTGTNREMQRPSTVGQVQDKASSGRFDARISSLQQTLFRQRSELGSKHPDVAVTLTRLAMLRIRNGELDIAVKLLLDALHIRKLIGNGKEIARSLHILGDLYCHQKHFRSALAYYLDAQRIELSCYGECHPEIANTLNKMGKVYAGRGEFDIAMENHQKALRVLKECFGEHLSHPSVAQTLICIGEVYYKERNSLDTIRSHSDDYGTFIETGMLDVIARAHEDRGSYRMAIAFLEEKLQLLSSGEGKDGQGEIAATLNSLGALSCNAGVFLEAIDYYDQALSIQLKLGCDKFQIAKARIRTATVEYYLGQYQKSLILLEDALALLRSDRVAANEAVAETLQRIGLVQIELFEYSAALKVLKESHNIQSKLLGEENQATLHTRLAIGSVLMNRCDFDASIELFSEILETQRRLHAPKHPYMAETLYYIGKAYGWRGDLSTAMKFFEESFYMADEFLGHDHPVQATTLLGIADLHMRKGKYKKAEQILAIVLSVRKETLGERHIDVALTLSSMGSCHTALGRFADALICYDEAIPMAEDAVGVSHPSVAEIYVKKAVLCLRRCQFDDAKESVEKGLEIYRRSSVPANHPRRLEAEETLERVERDEMLFV